MRIAYYDAEARCLYIHEPDLADWIDRPWIRRGEKLQSLRDLCEDPHDPALDAVEAIFVDSSADGEWPSTPPFVRNGLLRWTIGSAEWLLDDYKHEWSPVGKDDWKWGPLRDADEVGLITGPVKRIVFTDMDSD